MTKDELIKYCYTNIGTPYGDESYTCITWAEHLYNKYGWHPYSLNNNLANLKRTRKEFYLVEQPEFLDVAVFYPSDGFTRHIGLYLYNDKITHCSSRTNGVAISNITKPPWCMFLKGFYRFEGNCS